MTKNPLLLLESSRNKRRQFAFKQIDIPWIHQLKHAECRNEQNQSLNSTYEMSWHFSPAKQNRRGENSMGFLFPVAFFGRGRWEQRARLKQVPRPLPVVLKLLGMDGPFSHDIMMTDWYGHSYPFFSGELVWKKWGGKYTNTILIFLYLDIDNMDPMGRSSPTLHSYSRCSMYRTFTHISLRS